MSNRKAFDIAFVGLKLGVQEFYYEITDKFFEDFQEQDFTNCKVQVKLSLDKETNFMLLKFEIGGTVETECDRCLDPISLNLWDEFNITVKMVENPELMNSDEEDPDIFYISRGEGLINIENWIYEFINLSIPSQKYCAGNDDTDTTGCNPEALKVLNTLKIKEEKEPIQKENPIWKGLDQFKNLDN